MCASTCMYIGTVLTASRLSAQCLTWTASVGVVTCCFFFQAEDGIRYAQESRGLGDVYKRQALALLLDELRYQRAGLRGQCTQLPKTIVQLSLLHI